MSSHATLSAAADDRKARLAKLRSIKRKQPDDEVVPPESDRASPAVAPRPEGRPGAEGEGGEDREGEGGREDREPRRAQPDVAADVARLHLSGRNYDPESRGAKLGFETQPNLAAGDNTLEAKAAKLAEEVRRQQQEEDGGAGEDGSAAAAAAASQPIDLFKLQPKKPNWDLKRELNKRLEPLNARTDMAIARLLRERLQASSQQEQETQQKQTQKQKQKHQLQPLQPGQAAATDGGSGEGMLEGAALVESIRLREQEEEEDERRERELDEADEADD